MNNINDSWEIGGKTLTSRMLIGSALYPSPANMEEAIKESEAQIVTVALRRQAAGEGGGNNFWDIIKELDIHVLPNTAGCHSAKEAITTAQMAREVFDTKSLETNTTCNLTHLRQLRLLKFSSKRGLKFFLIPQTI